MDENEGSSMKGRLDTWCRSRYTLCFVVSSAIPPSYDCYLVPTPPTQSDNLSGSLGCFEYLQVATITHYSTCIQLCCIVESITEVPRLICTVLCRSLAWRPSPTCTIIRVDAMPLVRLWWKWLLAENADPILTAIWDNPGSRIYWSSLV